MSQVGKTLSEKIEDRLDKTALSGAVVDYQLGGVKFQTWIEIMEFAKLMALGDLAVPPHLRNNPGACLAILTRALRFGFDPFSLAEHSAEMVSWSKEGPKGQEKWAKTSRIAYDSYVIRAIINAHAPIDGSLSYVTAGEGDDMTVTVSCKRKDTGETISLTSKRIADRLAKLPKGKDTDGKEYIKGSPLWTTKPEQQISYDTARDLCRRWFPEVLMGWYDPDELEEANAAVAVDVTPPQEPATSGVRERLKQQRGDGKKAGFSEAGVRAALEHKKPEPAAVKVHDPEKIATITDGKIGEVIVTPETAAQQPPSDAPSDAVPSAVSSPSTVEAQHQETTELPPAEFVNEVVKHVVVTAGDVEIVPEIGNEEIVAEIEAKKRAISNVDSEGDALAIVSEVTAFLNKHERGDLLGDFLSTASTHLRRLKKKR